VEKGPSRAIFEWPIRVVRKSMPFPSYIPPPVAPVGDIPARVFLPLWRSGDLQRRATGNPLSGHLSPRHEEPARAD
jgi:hypothetical protein